MAVRVQRREMTQMLLSCFFEVSPLKSRSTFSLVKLSENTVDQNRKPCIEKIPTVMMSKVDIRKVKKRKREVGIFPIQRS